MPFLALKYSGISLFHFSFSLGEVLRAASTAATSLVRISTDFSFYFPFSGLPVESLVADFWLPVEAVFTLPDLACMAGGVFFFNFADAGSKTLRPDSIMVKAACTSFV